MTTDTAEPPAPPGATPQLNKALSQLQGELPRIKKTKTAEVKDQQGNRVLYKYDYADLGDVVADVGPLLAKCGLAFHCAPTINPGDRREMILLWSLLHESGEEKAGEWPLGPVNQKPQSLGSAITYGRRYCFTAATNIVLEDDDDGQRAQQDHGSRQSAGDAWEKSTPARPRQDAPAANGDDTRPWPVRALKQAQAGRFKTEAEAWKLWREAATRTVAGDCTPDQQDLIQNTVAKWVRGQRKKAAEMILEPLDDDSPWRDKILEEMASADEARAALAEIRQLAVDGQMDELAELLGRAVIARFPKAAITEASDA